MSESLGRYRIEGKIGSGAMGTVYLASRADRQFEQRVAIKIIRPEMMSEFMLRRIRSERQILAGLEHPHIARLIDGGTAEDGRPYLVMEFVDGLPLNEYLASRNPSRSARLELFLKICSAVQYAHQHLVIHRDLKPSNILVTGDGEPKLLDFGIAKLLDPDSAFLDHAETAAQFFTPAYASPEQVAGAPVTTASDIYSLGTLLLELLTDRPPQAGVNAAMEVALPGDLANIAAMTLREEPELRYRSAAELADDIRRFRENRPVIARADTIAYLARKFIARNRVASAAAAVSVIAMLAVILVLLAQIRNSNRQRVRAEHINAFMQGMLSGGASSADGKGGRNLKVVDVLGSVARDLDSRLNDQPVERAALRATIGTTFSRVGLLDAAGRELQTALRSQSALLGPSPAVAETLHDLGSNERYQGRLADAEAHLRRSIAMFHTFSDPAEYDATSDLAVTLFDEGRYREAAVLFERVYQIRRASYPPTDVNLIVMMNNLAGVRFNTGDFNGAIQMQRQVVEAHHKRDSPDSPSEELGYSEVNLGLYLRISGNAVAAEPVALASVDVLKKRLGDTHWMTGYAEVELAKTYSEEGKHVLAEQEARHALALITKALPPRHPEFAHVWIALGSILTAGGKPRDGLPYLRQAFAMRQGQSPKGGLRLAQAADALAGCLLAEGKGGEAMPYAQIAYAGYKNSYGAVNRITLAAWNRLKMSEGVYP